MPTLLAILIQPPSRGAADGASASGVGIGIGSLSRPAALQVSYPPYILHIVHIVNLTLARSHGWPHLTSYIGAGL